ncbi:MAG: flavodoxin family protein [Promethearchaeota archaeon]
MKVIVINSSPSGNSGNTAIILNPFIDGMKKAGAEVETYLTKNLNIKPCCGQFVCSIKNIDCIQKDDMADIHPKLLNADLWVFATPLYISTMNGPMKNFMDRMLVPWGETYIIWKNGRSHHPIKTKIDGGKVFLISSCGYWEIENFDLLIENLKEFCYHAERDFLGALLRPHAPMLKPMKESPKVKEIIESAFNAGVQLIQNFKISKELLDKVSQPLVPKENYVRTE